MYETSQATNIADLFGKLYTFATANGWTGDENGATVVALTKGTCSVAFRWASSSPTCAGVYQHLTYTSSATDPGNHTNDSGQGSVSGTDATLLAGRHVVLPNSSMQYWFFEDDTYIHVVVETATGRFAHFGFGILDKLGTWTGGAYSYGNRHDQLGGTSDLAVRPLLSYLLDGAAGVSSPTTVRPFCATIHMESMPNQTANGKWALAWAGGNANTGTDRATVARANVQGGFRGGPVARSFGRYGGAPSNGLVPMYPIVCYYDDPSNARWYEIGRMPDVRGFNVKYYSGGDEIVIGADTWVVFPARYKTIISSAGGTRNLGIAYKKVTT